jgi:hypothetical protein
LTVTSNTSVLVIACSTTYFALSQYRYLDTQSSATGNLTNRLGHDQAQAVLTSQRLGDQPSPNTQSTVEGSLIDPH